MDGESPQTQGESRTEKVGVAVTPSQKRAIVVVAEMRDTDQSNLLHEMSVQDVVVEFERIKAASGVAA